MADRYFNVVVTKAATEYSLNDRQLALWRSQQGQHAQKRLCAVPISGIGQTMNCRTYRCILCYKMGIPMFSMEKPCLACQRSFPGDIYGDHAVSCTSAVGVKHRDNAVRDTLYSLCYLSGITAGKEVSIGLTGEDDRKLRQADILLYGWHNGVDVCIDLTGSSPLTQSGLANFEPGRVVADAAKKKRMKYESKCETLGYQFLPFSFSSLGELEDDAIGLLRRIQKYSKAQGVGVSMTSHIFTRIGFSIAKGVGAHLVSRLPTNLL